MLSKELIEAVELVLTGAGHAEPLYEIRSAGGGSINSAYTFKSGPQKFFLKVNDAEKFPLMFETEAKGLALLSETDGLEIPRVIHYSTFENAQFLVLEYLERATENEEYYYALGEGLAALHKRTQKQFGLDHNNYIGLLPQDNTPADSWNEFFICRRIEPLLKQGIDGGELPPAIQKNFNSFFKKLDDLFPKEKPALLHGDLWSGNKMNTKNGPAIFDPAVYFGHREVDIAMTRLFGGFGASFYQGYNEDFVLEKGWEQRVELFQLHPLLVHTVLFGGGYAEDVISIIRKF